MKLISQIRVDRPSNFGADIPLDSTYGEGLGFWISRAIQYSIVIAGIIFFLKLVSGGFSYLTSAGDSGKIQAATKEITNALIGLILVISVFFIKQILKVLFGIDI